MQLKRPDGVGEVNCHVREILLAINSEHWETKAKLKYLNKFFGVFLFILVCQVKARRYTEKFPQDSESERYKRFWLR